MTCGWASSSAAQVGPEAQRPRAARVEVAAGPRDGGAQRAVAAVLVGRRVREAADRVVAEDDDDLAAGVRGLQLALEPAKLRLVEVAVRVQAIALGDRVDRDQPHARLRAEGVVGGLALGRRELVAVDVAEAVRVGLLAGRVQRLVGGPVGEAAAGVGRHDDRAAGAREQRRDPGDARVAERLDAAARDARPGPPARGCCPAPRRRGCRTRRSSGGRGPPPRTAAARGP